MSKGIVVGYDLAKDDCRISYFREGMEDMEDVAFSDSDHPYLIKNSICKRKGKDEWLIGQDAYETALFGDGMIVDKLLRLVERGGFTTFEGVRYSSDDLLYHFLSETLKALYKAAGTDQIERMTVCLQELDSRIMDAIVRAFQKLGLSREKLHVISHTESYLYYAMSQKRDLWANLSILYDLSGDGLNYYELRVRRGIQPNIADAKRTFLEEGFSLDILDSPAGRRMADSIMVSSVERQLGKKLVSSVYLSGAGMDHCRDWGEQFLRILCSHRRVFYVENLFAHGAVFEASDRLRETTRYPFRIMCEGRINVDIAMDVYVGTQQKTLTIANVGSNWYDARAEFDIIPDHEENLRLRVKKLGEARPLNLEIPFGDLLKNGNKKQRIGVRVFFTSDNDFMVILRDKGFGEFYPSTDKVVQQSFRID